MRVNWNGKLSKSFGMSRGVWQGDSLSPYFFVICMERLGQIINLAVERKMWNPIKLHKNGPNISRLFFANDLFSMWKLASIK